MFPASLSSLSFFSLLKARALPWVIGALVLAGLAAAGLAFMAKWRADITRAIRAEADLVIARRSLQAWEHASRRLAEVEAQKDEIIFDLEGQMDVIEAERDAAIARFRAEGDPARPSGIGGRHVR